MTTVRELHVRHHAMGSPWEVDVYDCKESDHALVTDMITQHLDDFESTYSRFKTDSFISSLRKTSGKVTVTPTFSKMLRVCFELYDATGGLFNPCIADVLEDLGYDAQYSLKQRDVVAQAPRLDEIIERVSDAEIILSAPVALDFGAVGKGCAVDELVRILQDRGYSQFTVNGSGDMRHVGPNEIRVGLEHPEDPSQAIGVYSLHNQALACSGSNRRNWNSNHHIVDPYTHISPNYIRSTWVATEEAMYADALATSLFLVVPEKLAHICPFEYVLVNQDLRLARSAGWSGEVFS